MKRNAQFTAIIMIILVVFLISGCGASNLTAPETSAGASEQPETSQQWQSPESQSPPDEETPGDTAAAEISDAAPSPESSVETNTPDAVALKYETATYENGKIIIKYPQFTNLADSEVRDKINGLISDSALRDIKDIEGQAVEYDLDYEVTFLSPEIISVFFNGYMNFEQSAHPSNVFFTINIDVKNQTTISLSQLVYMTDGFVELFKNGELSSMLYDMEPDIETSLKEYLFQSGMLDWSAELKNADTEGSYTFSYLTVDALVISVNVPHVYGDHVEISLTYEQLAGYQTDNEIWLAITPDA